MLPFPIPLSTRRCVYLENDILEMVLTLLKVEMTNWEKGHYINYK